VKFDNIERRGQYLPPFYLIFFSSLQIIFLEEIAASPVQIIAEVTDHIIELSGGLVPAKAIVFPATFLFQFFLDADACVMDCASRLEELLHQVDKGIPGNGNGFLVLLLILAKRKGEKSHLHISLRPAVSLSANPS